MSAEQALQIAAPLSENSMSKNTHPHVTEMIVLTDKLVHQVRGISQAAEIESAGTDNAEGLREAAGLVQTCPDSAQRSGPKTCLKGGGLHASLFFFMQVGCVPR